MYALWSPEARSALAGYMGPYDPTEPHLVELVDGDGSVVTVVEHYGRVCEAEWAVEWLNGTRTATEQARGRVYRVCTLLDAPAEGQLALL